MLWPLLHPCGSDWEIAGFVDPTYASFVAPSLCVLMPIAQVKGQGRTLPAHEVVGEKFLDSPAKTMVAYHVSSPAAITATQQQQLLTALYKRARYERDYTYVDEPDQVFMYIYPSHQDARAQEGAWRAMLWWMPDEGEPRVTLGP